MDVQHIGLGEESILLACEVIQKGRWCLLGYPMSVINLRIGIPLTSHLAVEYDIPMFAVTADGIRIRSSLIYIYSSCRFGG